MLLLFYLVFIDIYVCDVVVKVLVEFLFFWDCDDKIFDGEWIWILVFEMKVWFYDELFKSYLLKDLVNNYGENNKKLVKDNEFFIM